MNKENIQILLIDDEENILLLWRKVIDKLGYHTHCFNNGLEALMDFKTKPNFYDIVITDDIMPEISGAELVKKILNIREDTKIIIASNYLKDIDFAVGGLENEVLEKPLISKLLIDVIQMNLLFV